MTPWRQITWHDRANRPVRQLVFHVTESDEVHKLPFPPLGHTVTQTEWPTPTPEDRYFCRCRAKVGDTFEVDTPLGKCMALVTEVNTRTARYHFEFTTPDGNTHYFVGGWSNGAFLERPALPNEVERRFRLSPVLAGLTKKLLEAPSA